MDDERPAAGADATEDVAVRAGAASLPGRLNVPVGATGIVVFAHGSGSSMRSPRNVSVAQALQRRGLATLLLDLLTPEEGRDRARVFDIELLAERLTGATRWLRHRVDHGRPPIGLFGASTGAAAALWAAGEPAADVAAVVSRGGRPDLAAARLRAVTAPTLLIVGARDDVVLQLNREAQALLRCENRLSVVLGATHLFEEPGALEAVAAQAGDWFVERLRPARGQAGETTGA